MKDTFSDQENQAAQTIIAHLTQGRVAQGIEAVRALKDDMYAAIPARQRQSRGITWVLQRLSRLLTLVADSLEQVRAIALILYENLAKDDRLIGLSIFLMAEYGKTHPAEVLGFLEQVADADDWVVREFAAGGLHALIKPGRTVILPWLKTIAQSDRPNLRRFVSEGLRPVVDNRWLNDEPETSLEILRLLFREAHPYPRTSVGNNLSDLARRNPALILGIVKELVENGDENSYWIAYRACRNLVKKTPIQVMDLLKVDEYHYKDRNFYREESTQGD